VQENLRETPAGLGRSAAQNAAHTLAGQAVKFILQLASVVVLARLLSEQDFGLVGMVLAIVGIGHIIKDFGLASAAIQARDLTRGQRDNLFWLNTGAGLLMAGLAAASAPFIMSFYGRDDVGVIVLWLAPSLLLAGMSTQYRADLARRLRLGRAAIAELTSTALGFAAGVATALLGWGPGALIAQQLVGGLAGLVLLGLLAGWLPGLYRRYEPMRQLFGVGIPLFLTQIVTYIASNADSVIIGRFFGPIPVGLYNRGLQLVRVPMTQVRGPLDTLSLSVLAKVTNDPTRFLSFVQRGHLVMIYPLLAVAGGLIAAAPVVIDLALGSRWTGAAVYVQLIALGEAMNSLASAGGWIYASQGLGTALLRFTLFSAFVRLLFLTLGTSFGPIGVAGGFAIAQCLLWPVSLWWIGRVSGLATGAMIVTALRCVLVCAVPSVATWTAVSAMNGWPSSISVPFAVGVHLIVFALLAFLPWVRRHYRALYETVKMVRH
jgi:O-antigen/teichoic acid export membrane protein